MPLLLCCSYCCFGMMFLMRARQHIGIRKYYVFAILILSFDFSIAVNTQSHYFLQRRVNGVIPIGVLALPAVHREGQVLILDVARLHTVTRELGGVHGHGAVRAREGQEGVGSDHAGAVRVDGPRDPAVGGLQRAVGDVDRAIGRVVVPVEGGIEVGERAAGGVQLVAGERVVDTALRCAVVQRRQEQAQEDDCWLHGGGPDCRDDSSFSSRRIREEMVEWRKRR
ncbi:unnamed protein product [Musa acuminata var. zebrina]